jgi:hypothetical protein
MKLSRPSRWGAACFTIALFTLLDDLWVGLSQSLIEIPIYHTGTLYILWSDYLMITLPVSFVWLALAYGFWNPGGTT